MRFLLSTIGFLTSNYLFAWGFYAHKEINRLAVFALPEELMAFYKPHLTYLQNQAVLPDKRRYIIKEEACRHYIDIDVYESYNKNIPEGWEQAKEVFTEDTLLKHGIVPWQIYKMTFQLKNAFQEKDIEKILKVSSELGHYIADSNVPLHTTSNYNGQKTNQHGIHGLWESRIPELFSEKYDFFVGRALYINDLRSLIWDNVWIAHAAVDSVLSYEKQATIEIPEDQKYSFEERGTATIKVYSRKYSSYYDNLLAGMVERQMRNSILMVASVWYTCWRNAGMPDLKNEHNIPESPAKQEKEEIAEVPSDCNH
ncbi:zinc dependent phospholipase C family protein, partial [Sporocytophaga myxococcoides]|uniref:zinc dependent phospholipase C family protein n=1 Tax=Sporocytophaga myxococcoides TaxID=153721 RepID=UPI0003F560E1